MIELTKLSRQHFVLNEDQIQFIEFIPETKITMMNGEFVLVREDETEVMRRIVAFRQKILPAACKQVSLQED